MAGSTSSTKQRKRQRDTPTMSLISASSIFSSKFLPKQKTIALVCRRRSSRACQGTTRHWQSVVRLLRAGCILFLCDSAVKPNFIASVYASGKSMKALKLRARLRRCWLLYISGLQPLGRVYHTPCRIYRASALWHVKAAACHGRLPIPLRV